MVKYLTKEGLEKLKKELERLKTIDRAEIVKRIESSAALGDLKENNVETKFQRDTLFCCYGDKWYNN